MTQGEMINKLEACGRKTTMLLLTLQSTLPNLKIVIKQGKSDTALEILEMIEREFESTKKLIWDEQNSKG